MFEEWMNYINPVYDGTVGRYDGGVSSQLNAYQDRNTYSRFRYPDDYRRKIQITKFERDFLQNPNDKNNTFKNMPLLTYHFIDTFPVNLNAVQMSYEGSTFLQVTVAFTYLRHTIEKHGNVQQSVREKLSNSNQTIQINPLRPRAVGREIAPSSSDPNPTKPVGYVTGEPYYGPYHEHMGVKMVGERHAPYPHAIIYDTFKESLSPDSIIVGDPVTEINPVTEEQTTAGEGTTQTTQTTETSGGGTTTTESTTTTTSTDSSGETTSSTESSSSSGSDGSSSGGSSSYGGYYGY